MTTLKKQGEYYLIHSEIDNDYELYHGEEFITSFLEKDKAEKAFEELVGKGELLANEKND